jgi:hypothetical protein
MPRFQELRCRRQVHFLGCKSQRRYCRLARGAEGLADGLMLRPVASLTQVGTLLGSVTTPAHTQLTAGGGALPALEAAVHHRVSPYLIPRVGIINTHLSMPYQRILYARTARTAVISGHF